MRTDQAFEPSQTSAIEIHAKEVVFVAKNIYFGNISENCFELLLCPKAYTILKDNDFTFTTGDEVKNKRILPRYSASHISKLYVVADHIYKRGNAWLFYDKVGPPSASMQSLSLVFANISLAKYYVFSDVGLLASQNFACRVRLAEDVLIVSNPRTQTFQIYCLIGRIEMDGDLFPRGRAEGSVPRVRKRDGTFVYAEHGSGQTPAKRPRRDSSLKNVEKTESHVVGALSAKRLTIGTTLLGVVTLSKELKVEITLPGGAKACADPGEILVNDTAQHRGDTKKIRLLHRASSRHISSHADADSDAEGMHSDSDSDASITDDTDDEELSLHTVRTLHQAVSPGSLVRVAVVSTEKTKSGHWKIVVSCRPSLINVDVGVVGTNVVGARSATVLHKGELMWGAIKSVEDHGYIVDFGASVQAVGFLRYSDVVPERQLFPGFPVEVVPLESENTGKTSKKVVPVSFVESLVNTATAVHTPDISLASLRAGVRIQAHVAQIQQGGGVVLKLFGMFSVVVDRFHVQHPLPKVHELVDARLLYVDASTKRIGATLLPCLVRERRLRKAPTDWTVGRILKPIVIVRVDSGHGMTVKPASSEDCNNNSMQLSDPVESHEVPLFAHVSRISDDHMDKLEKRYNPGFVIENGARIVSCSQLDGVVNVDLRSSILSRKALSIAEVRAGETYDSKILSRTSAGSLVVAVDSDTHMRGIVPAVHVSDTFVSVKRLLKSSRFATGVTIRCVCLTVDRDAGKIVLTSKASLVNSHYEPLTSYEQAKHCLESSEQEDAATDEEKCIFDGTVVKITEQGGILVAFPNKVLGLIPHEELRFDTSGDSPNGALPVDDNAPKSRLSNSINANVATVSSQARPESTLSISVNLLSRSQIDALFPVGRSIRVRIVSVNVQKRRMTLSLRLHSCSKSRGSRASETTSRRELVGKFVHGSVISVEEDAKVFKVSVKSYSAMSQKAIEQDGNKELDGESKEIPLASSLVCSLPFEHLSDFRDMARRMSEELMKFVSDTSSPFPLVRALVLGGNGELPLITLKPSLIDAFERSKLPGTFKQVAAEYNRNDPCPDNLVSLNSTRQACNDQKLQESPSATKKLDHLRGFVKATLPSGIIVGFLGNLVGFTRKSRISDDFISDPTRALRIHDTVCGVVEGVDFDRERFNLSLRRTDVGDVGIAEDTHNYFNDFARIQDLFGLSRVENDFPVGAVVDSVLDASRQYGKVLQLTSTHGAKAYGVVLDEFADNSGSIPRNGGTNDDVMDVDSESYASAAAATAEARATLGSTPVRAPKDSKRSKTPASSRKTRQQRAADENAKTSITSARVLDVDPFSGVVDVTLDLNLIGSATRRSPLRAGKRFNATVLLVKDEYLVLSIVRSGKSTIAFALLPFLQSKLPCQFRRGSKLSCVAVPSAGERNLVVVDWNSLNATQLMKGTSFGANSAIHIRRDAKLAPSKLEPGMYVAGKVSSVLPLQVNVAICPGVVGRLHVTNNYKAVKMPHNLGPIYEAESVVLSPLAVGDKVTDLLVLSTRDVKSDPSDSVTETASNANLENIEKHQCMKVLELSRAQESASNSSSFVAGSQTVAFVKGVKKNSSGQVVGFWLLLSPDVTGFCSAVDALLPLRTSDYETRRNPCSEMSKAYAVPVLSTGSPVFCSLISDIDLSTSFVNVSLSENGGLSVDGSACQNAFYGIVSSVRPGDGLRVEIPWHARPLNQKERRWGLVGMCDVSDNYDHTVKLMDDLKPGNVVKVKIVDVGTTGCEKSNIALTMRPSIIEDKVEGTELVESPCDPLILGSLNKESVDTKIRGFVRTVGKVGCFVSIGRYLVARVLLSDLADEFIKEPATEFPPGALVSGRVSSVNDSDNSKVHMILRKRQRKLLKSGGNENEMVRDAEYIDSECHEGALLSGIVRRVERFGAIVQLQSRASALLHVSEADQDRLVGDPWAEWTVGQALGVVVIKSESSHKYRVGTKRCYFEAAGLSTEQVENVLEKNSSKVMLDLKEEPDALSKFTGSVFPLRLKESESVSHLKYASKADDFLGEADGSHGGKDTGKESDTDSEIDIDNKGITEIDILDNAQCAGALSIDEGFAFEDDRKISDYQADGAERLKSEEIKNSDSEVSSTDDEYESSGKRTKMSSKDKRAKKKARQQAEIEVRAREEALATSSDSPQTADDFERLVMSQPNASHVWIRYMAFRMSLSQFDKARAVAESALETIALSEELERVNVWIAYINMEAANNLGRDFSGTGSAAGLRDKAAAVFRIFDRACQRITDVKDFHLQAAAALRASHPEIASEILHRGLKLFKKSKKMWLAVGTLHFAAGRLDAARKTLERALLSVEKHDHVALIMKFAQLEYRYGSLERGRTVFESLVGNFPKKLDLWSVYMDMEISLYRGSLKENNEIETQSAVELSRRLFERCLSLDFSTKKTKFIFKRWLAFEVEIGDKAAQASVRSKARQYVESKLVAI